MLLFNPPSHSITNGQATTSWSRAGIMAHYMEGPRTPELMMYAGQKRATALHHMDIARTMSMIHADMCELTSSNTGA